MKTIDIQSLVRENIKGLKPYSSARDEFEGNAGVFLDANENPFQTDYNRYPDPHQRALKKEIALLKNVTPEQIFLGNGSDEAIDLLFRIFCEPKQDNVVIPQPTYGMYAVSAGINNIAVDDSLLTNSFDVDSEIVLSRITPQTKIIFLCSPNNPSGNLLDPKEIEIILNSFSGILVVDEAYIDFTTAASWIEKLNDFNNLVILQTFSKAWGLAGLRLGMCFASPEIIAWMNKVKPPYNINGFTQSTALSVIQNKKEEKSLAVKSILAEREILKTILPELSIVIQVFPTDANFILVAIKDAKKVYGQLVEKGIIVRDRSSVILCDDCLRITVGTKEENNQLIAALRLL